MTVHNTAISTSVCCVAALFVIANKLTVYDVVLPLWSSWELCSSGLLCSFPVLFYSRTAYHIPYHHGPGHLLSFVSFTSISTVFFCYYAASQFCSTVGPPIVFPTTVGQDISCPFVSFTSISTVFLFSPYLCLLSTSFFSFLFFSPIFSVSFSAFPVLLRHFSYCPFSPWFITETTSPLWISVLLNCSLLSSLSFLSFTLSFNLHYFPWSPGPEWGNFTTE